MSERPDARDAGADPPPPLLGTWRNLYLLVAVELALLVLGFTALTRWAQS